MKTRIVENKEPKPSWEIVSEVIDCSICKGEKTLMVETVFKRRPTDPPSKDLQEDYVENYLCMHCGYSTTSDMEIGSDLVENTNKKTPRLVKDLSIADNVRNIVWYPAIINMTPLGILYPDGTPSEWEWVVAPYTRLTEDERKAYLSDDSPVSFEYRLAVEKAMTFKKDSFQDAFAYLGALVEKTNA